MVQTLPGLFVLSPGQYHRGIIPIKPLACEASRSSIPLILDSGRPELASYLLRDATIKTQYITIKGATARATFLEERQDYVRRTLEVDFSSEFLIFHLPSEQHSRLCER